MSDHLEPSAASQQPDWGSLPLTTRLLLLACYFVQGAGLASLASFFAAVRWPAQIGIIAACLAPQGALWILRDDLRRYLPGFLLAMFALFIGMAPGVVAEKLALGTGESAAISNAVFVATTAAGMATVVG